MAQYQISSMTGNGMVTVFVVGVDTSSVPINVLQHLHTRGLTPAPREGGYLVHGYRSLPCKSTIKQNQLGNLSSLHYRFRVRGGSASYPASYGTIDVGLRDVDDPMDVDDLASSSAMNIDDATPSLQACPSTPHSANTQENIDLREILKDIRHVNYSILQYAASLVADVSLVFDRPPKPQESEPFVHLEEPSGTTHRANSGPYSLDVRAVSNQSFLQYENWLCSTINHMRSYSSLRVQPHLSESLSALVCAANELERLDSIKEREWERQRCPEVSLSNPGVLVFDNSRYFVHPYLAWNPMVLVAHIVGTTMHLLFNIPRRTTKVLMAGLRTFARSTVITLSPGIPSADIEGAVSRIPQDLRTMVSNLDLDPVTHASICCPSCYALYPIEGSTTLSRCTHQPTPSSDVCDAQLYRNRLIRDKSYESPVRTQLHQDMKAWMGRMLSHPGLEDEMDKAYMSRSQAGRERLDIWDAPALFRIPDPSIEGAPFVMPPTPVPGSAPEGRYVFTLAQDAFNLYQMKEAKQHVTATAVYMCCLNLPPYLRFLPENVYLVCVIPGPGKPSLEQINHALAPLVDELLEFYTSGIWYLQTAKYLRGRLVRCALGPLVADLPAARQTAGFPNFNHLFFCSCCNLKLTEMENLDPSSWSPRIWEDLKPYSRMWRDANSEAERTTIYDTYGIRWSELHRLPYWDPVFFTVVDSMHNHYLGLLQDHCRHIWGMNLQDKDGEGQYPPERVTYAQLHQDKMTAGWYYLQQQDRDKLLKCPNAVLWHMCVKADLRRARAREKKPLVEELLTWRSSPSYKLPLGIEALVTDFEPPPPSTSGATQEDLDNATAALAKGTTFDSLKNRKLEVLRTLCEQRSLDLDGPRKDLARRLLDWRSQQTDGVMAHVASAVAAGSRAVKQKSSSIVLGRETLRSIHEDIQKTVLPSWMSPAPGNKRREAEKKLMLDNFMHLVTAVAIAGMLAISDAHIAAYRKAIMHYLETMKDLYKEATFKPNHHLAVHFADTFLPNFGSLYPIRAFHTERQNFLLQMENTNMKFGELELTYMKHTSRSANMQYLMQDPWVYRHAQELIDAYNDVHFEDRRGTRIRESFRAPLAHGEKENGTEPGVLNEECFGLLCRYLGRSGRSIGAGGLTKRVDFLSRLHLRGVSYTVSSRSHRDCNIYFHLEGAQTEAAGQIESIFRHTRTSDSEELTETFIVVKRYAELSAQDAMHDPYRCYEWAGGRLYYNDLSASRPVLIHSEQLVSHISRTPVQIPAISRPCIHALALNRLLYLSEEASKVAHLPRCLCSLSLVPLTLLLCVDDFHLPHSLWNSLSPCVIYLGAMGDRKALQRQDTLDKEMKLQCMGILNGYRSGRVQLLYARRAMEHLLKDTNDPTLLDYLKRLEQGSENNQQHEDQPTEPVSLEAVESGRNVITVEQAEDVPMEPSSSIAVNSGGSHAVAEQNIHAHIEPVSSRVEEAAIRQKRKREGDEDILFPVLGYQDERTESTTSLPRYSSVVFPPGIDATMEQLDADAPAQKVRSGSSGSATSRDKGKGREVEYSAASSSSLVRWKREDQAGSRSDTSLGVQPDAYRSTTTSLSDEVEMATEEGEVSDLGDLSDIPSSGPSTPAISLEVALREMASLATPRSHPGEIVDFPMATDMLAMPDIQHHVPSLRQGDDAEDSDGSDSTVTLEITRYSRLAQNEVPMDITALSQIEQPTEDMWVDEALSGAPLDEEMHESILELVTTPRQSTQSSAVDSGFNEGLAVAEPMDIEAEGLDRAISPLTGVSLPVTPFREGISNVSPESLMEGVLIGAPPTEQMAVDPTDILESAELASSTLPIFPPSLLLQPTGEQQSPSTDPIHSPLGLQQFLSTPSNLQSSEVRSQIVQPTARQSQCPAAQPTTASPVPARSPARSARRDPSVPPAPSPPPAPS
ncbi:hypothetical protein NM688_g4476 [Phlebia brevispora]|uniref:Uncharacterized protein n=1 Tax=Phlebia brevispora TaxID=194682 RepID=A0ACC1T3E2_9APHY|nr:hypothetical protein NM688_g4476 [Phlebia brevispora]